MTVSFLLFKELAVTVLRINDIQVNLNVIIGVKFSKNSNDVSFIMVVWSFTPMGTTEAGLARMVLTFG